MLVLKLIHVKGPLVSKQPPCLTAMQTEFPKPVIIPLSWLHMIAPYVGQESMLPQAVLRHEAFFNNMCN